MTRVLLVLEEHYHNGGSTEAAISQLLWSEPRIGNISPRCRSVEGETVAMCASSGPIGHTGHPTLPRSS